MSQKMSNDSDSCEGSQLPCQCSAMSNVDSIRQRDRSERNLGSKRISKVQDLPRGLETLQNMFELIRNRDASPSIQESQQICLDNSRIVDSLDQTSLASSHRPIEVQNDMFSRYGHRHSCSPRNIDLPRNLTFEAARRVQETSNFQDNQHRQLSIPSSLLDSNSDLHEISLNDMENDVDDVEDLSNSTAKDKIKMQVLNSYQHQYEPGVHSHLLSEAHSYIYKHENPCNYDNCRVGSSLDTGDGLMGFQHQRQHSHHHKISSLFHHQHQPSHSCGTTSNLSHRNSPAAHHRMGVSGNGNRGSQHHGIASGMSGNSSNSSLINHGSLPTVHRHAVNTHSSLLTTPLISHHHRSSSSSLTRNSTTNHHHVSSGISCESSSSNANTRTYSRLDHIHDAKHTAFMAVNNIQVPTPSKSKCQCHMIQ